MICRPLERWVWVKSREVLLDWATAVTAIAGAIATSALVAASRTVVPGLNSLEAGLGVQPLVWIHVYQMQCCCLFWQRLPGSGGRRENQPIFSTHLAPPNILLGAALSCLTPMAGTDSVELPQPWERLPAKMILAPPHSQCPGMVLCSSLPCYGTGFQHITTGF